MVQSEKQLVSKSASDNIANLYGNFKYYTFIQ
jgi:hypothetical protein